MAAGELPSRPSGTGTTPPGRCRATPSKVWWSLPGTPARHRCAISSCRSGRNPGGTLRRAPRDTGPRRGSVPNTGRSRRSLMRATRLGTRTSMAAVSGHGPSAGRARSAATPSAAADASRPRVETAGVSSRTMVASRASTALSVGSSRYRAGPSPQVPSRSCWSSSHPSRVPCPSSSGAREMTRAVSYTDARTLPHGSASMSAIRRTAWESNRRSACGMTAVLARVPVTTAAPWLCRRSPSGPRRRGRETGPGRVRSRPHGAGP